MSQKEINKMHRFLIIVEKATEIYSAYSPDLLGCVATGRTIEETERNMYEAIKLHLEGLREDNVSIPLSTSSAQYLLLD